MHARIHTHAQPGAHPQTDTHLRAHTQTHANTYRHTQIQTQPITLATSTALFQMELHIGSHSYAGEVGCTAGGHPSDLLFFKLIHYFYGVLNTVGVNLHVQCFG